MPQLRSLVIGVKIKLLELKYVNREHPSAQHSTVRLKQLCQLRETHEIYKLMNEFSWRPRRPIAMSRTTPQCKTFGRVEASDVILTRH